MFENAKIKEGDRRVEYIFDGDVTVDEHGKEWVQRIKLVCDHDKGYKRYTASVWRCLARVEGPFNVERFDDVLSGHNNDTLLREPVARYSANSFDAFCGRAMAKAASAIKDEDNFSLAAVLLRIAAEYSRNQVLV
jgi:hypothetical protein